MSASGMRRKAGWFYFNVIEPERIRLVQEAGFVFTPTWEGLCDVDMLEQEVQESIESVQEQFCREGRIWQGSRYQAQTVASKSYESTNGRVVRGRKRNKDSANALESHLKSKVN
tara:strand:+ start:4363 stop:4704 length:342 start_codon:yes stop_codon:yes gene_type:complete